MEPGKRPPFFSVKHRAVRLTPWLGSLGLHTLAAAAAFALALSVGETAAPVLPEDGGTDEPTDEFAPTFREKSSPALKRVVAFMPSAKAVALAPPPELPAFAPPDPPAADPPAPPQAENQPVETRNRPPAAKAAAVSSGRAKPGGRGRGGIGSRPGRGTGVTGSGTGAAGVGDGRAAYRSRAALIYPPASRQRGESGTVLIRIRVEADGHISAVEIVQSSGHSALDQAALRCAQASTYRPAVRGGQPVASWVEAPFRFAVR